MSGYDTVYGQNNPVTPLRPAEIDQMRKRLFDNISDLNGNKQRMRPDEYLQLLNYHHYALTILDNMKIIRRAEMSDPYNRNMGLTARPRSNIETINPLEDKLKVVYKRDGRATIVDTTGNDKSKFKGEWEKQFDEQVYNPPAMGTIVSSNLWGLPQ
jgi:hypothetical protein